MKQLPPLRRRLCEMATFWTTAKTTETTKLEGVLKGRSIEPPPSEMHHSDPISHALNIVHSTGARIMALAAGTTIGVWSDTDGLAVREALHTLGMGELPVRYLEEPGIPIRYKVRR